MNEDRRPVLEQEIEPIPDWARELVRWLDTAIKIPGTEITLGLDAILGLLLPSAGDALTAIGSLALFGLAVRYRVPKVILARMLLNVAVDTLLGSIPLLGDLFDLFWRSNKKNLDLIERYRESPEAPATFGDYVVVGVAGVVLLALVLAPIALGLIVVRALIRYVSN